MGVDLGLKHKEAIRKQRERCKPPTKPTLTMSDVFEGLRKIRDFINDDEAAHICEDDLYLEVLTAIANNNCHCPSACARAAIQSQKLKFARWHS